MKNVYKVMARFPSHLLENLGCETHAAALNPYFQRIKRNRIYLFAVRELW